MTVEHGREFETDIDLNRVWTDVAAEVWAEPVGRFESVVARLLKSPALSRALVTTPSLMMAWIFATLVVMAVGVIVTAASGDPWFALVAPALAGSGVAYAYGPGSDPAFELGKTMPLPDRLVLLVRVLAVFGVNAVFGLVASLVSTVAIGLTFGWLLPMTAVSALGLAVAALARSANVGVATAIGSWLVFVLAGAAQSDDISIVIMSESLRPVYVLVVFVCGGLALFATSNGRWDREWQWR